VARILFRLSVAGKRIPVIHDPSIEGEYGHFDAGDMVIRLSDMAMTTETLFRETLYHEVFHVCMFLSGLSFAVSKELEEQIVRMCDGILWDALKNVDDTLKKKSSTKKSK
jgi:hypothetical protein